MVLRLGRHAVWFRRCRGWPRAHGLGRRHHGRSLSPFPVPARHAELVDRGPYRLLRHPIYVGGFLLFAGLSLVLSIYGLLLSAVLGAFWIAKARLEERHLLERFPEYAEYRRRTLI